MEWTKNGIRQTCRRDKVLQLVFEITNFDVVGKERKSSKDRNLAAREKRVFENMDLVQSWRNLTVFIKRDIDWIAKVERRKELEFTGFQILELWRD